MVFTFGASWASCTSMNSMRLVEAVERLSKLDEDATICVRKPWTGDAECVVISFEGKLPSTTRKAGFEYFLEVDVALEVLEVFGDRRPSLDERLELLIYYATNDAYPDWLDV